MLGTIELHWGDVVDVLRGLESWFEEEGREVEVWFRVVEGEEEGRGQVGDGFLRKSEAVGGGNGEGKAG
jgi:hypothetical protein